MAFHVTHRYGAMEQNPPFASFADLLRELDDRPEDIEHADVSVTHESEWCISVFRGGYVILENFESGGECHMRGVSDGKVLELWALLAKGDLESVKSEPWTPGYK
jgi:hypothetical protein